MGGRTRGYTQTHHSADGLRRWSGGSMGPWFGTAFSSSTERARRVRTLSKRPRLTSRRSEKEVECQARLCGEMQEGEGRMR